MRAALAAPVGVAVWARVATAPVGVTLCARARAVLVCITLCAGVAAAQDFAVPRTSVPAEGPAVALELGLPDVEARPGVVLATTRWLGDPTLQTRAIAAGLGMGAARVALGLSQTGDPEVGWTALGAAAGGVFRSCAAGVRAVARRDRSSALAWSRDAPVGAEIGVGAWVEVGVGTWVWMSAPQMWKAGAAPPLERPLATGLALSAGDLALRISRSARPSGATEHEALLALRIGVAESWVVARDRPLRGGLGLGVRARRLGVEVGVDGHPVLGETSRLALSWH